MREALSIIFICSQNTCRSIAAEAVFTYLITETKMRFQVASSGTDAVRDRRPDIGIRQAAELRGYSLENYYSKPLQDSDLLTFDYLLAMDRSILRKVRIRAKKERESKIRLLGDYSSFFHGKEILYPASQEIRDFICVFDYIEDACLGLWKHLTQAMR